MTDGKPAVDANYDYYAYDNIILSSRDFVPLEWEDEEPMGIQSLYLLLLAHSVVTFFIASLVLGGNIRKEKSPYAGPANGLIKKARENDEWWERSHRYYAKRRIFWATGELIIGLIMATTSWLPPGVSIMLFVAGSLMATVPIVETVAYINRL